MALGVNKLQTIINTDKLDIDQLFNIMMNQDIAEHQHLPETGIPQEWESLLSSIFIVSPEYGTRSTAIILQSRSGEVSIYDRRYHANGKPDNDNEKYRQFTIQT